ARDVARLGAFGRDTRQHVAGVNFRTVLDRQNGVHREQVAGVVAVRELQDLAVLVLDHDRRAKFAAARGSAPVDDDTAGDAGRFVRHFADRYAIDEILELDRAV